MRFSYHRDIIYKSICEVDNHPTAADIFDMVKPRINKISLGTIYRNLSQLIETNMIHELNISGISHYDGNLDQHQHFVCKHCNSIIDCSIQNDLDENKIKGTKEFDIQEVDIIFSGLCQECKLN